MISKEVINEIVESPCRVTIFYSNGFVKFVFDGEPSIALSMLDAVPEIREKLEAMTKCPLKFNVIGEA